MNNRHLIDNAIFDTTYTEAETADGPRAQVDEFIKTSLMQVIDEVFDEVEESLTAAGSVMRLERLEMRMARLEKNQGAKYAKADAVRSKKVKRTAKRKKQQFEERPRRGCMPS